MQNTEFVENLRPFIEMIEPIVKRPSRNPESIRTPLQNLVFRYCYQLVQTFFDARYMENKVQLERDLQYIFAVMIFVISNDSDNRYRDVMSIEIDTEHSILRNAVMVPKENAPVVGKPLHHHELRWLLGMAA